MRRRGFTIVELMVTIGLVGIMTAIGLANFRRSGQIQTVEGANERLRQAMTQAKVNSASGKKDCGVCGATGGVCGNGDLPLQGWEVSVNTSVSPVTYTVRGLCGSGAYPTPPLPTPFFSKTESLPPGISVNVRENAVAVTPSPVLFRPFGGGIVPEINASTILTIEVVDGDGNISSFTIDGSGEVQ